jgi:glycosyltransferase involved in cell wall biosynthesis
VNSFVKVIMVTPYAGRDGIATYSRNLLIDPLTRQGTDCALIVSGIGPGDAKPPDGRRTPPVLGEVSWSPAALARAVWRAQQWVPDVVHLQFAVASYGGRTLPLLFLLEGLRLVGGTPVVITFHEVTRDVERLGRLGRMLYRHLGRRASVSIVHTRAAADLLANLLDGGRGRVELVDHPVRELQLGTRAEDAAPIEPAGPDADALRARHALGDRRVLLAFGFIHVHKGLDVTVKALARLRATEPDALRRVVLVVAGDVRRREGIFRLFELADRVHLRRARFDILWYGLRNHVRFTGFVPSSDVQGWFETADVVVLPYVKTEQSGVANLAIAYGRPVIASNVGGLAELFQDTGVMCRPGNADDLARAIARMTRDEGLHKSGAGYRDLLSRAHPDRVAGQVSGLYAELLSGSGRL